MKRSIREWVTQDCYQVGSDLVTHRAMATQTTDDLINDVDARIYVELLQQCGAVQNFVWRTVRDLNDGARSPVLGLSSQ